MAYLVVAAAERGEGRHVASGGARRGRRDNGLVAAEYSAVGDVDPRVGEHLLDVLAVQGIAAYLQPATDLHPVTRTSTVPARPTDRLYVDRVHLGTARDYLTRLRDDEEADRAPEPGPGRLPSRAAGSRPGQRPGDEAIGPAPRDGEPADVEAEFARIVASFDADPELDAAPWPAAENVADGASSGPVDRPARRRTDRPATDSPATDSPAADGPAADGPAADGPASDRPDLDRRDWRRVDPRGGEAAADEPSLLDGLDTFGADLPDDDEGYTPPPAPPLPRLSRAAVVAVLSMAFGLALFFSPGLLPISTNQALLLGFGALLTGFVILIWRLRPGDDEDSDPDDGAVV